MPVLILPDQGQLVQVRNQRYVVSEVVRSCLPPKALLWADDGPQHFVTLASIEDDVMGDDLCVVWELEPGARTYDKAALPAPTGFDNPKRLGAFLNPVHWTAASSADIQPPQEPFRSLLRACCSFGVQESDTIDAMLAESESAQAEVTAQLGEQVQRAVKVLVQAIDRVHRDRDLERSAAPP